MWTHEQATVRNRALAHHTIVWDGEAGQVTAADLSPPLKWGLTFELLDEAEVVLDKLYRVTHDGGTYPFEAYRKDIGAGGRAFLESMSGQ